MTLYDRDAYELYTEGVQRNTDYRVIPMGVSELTNELESIYTYSHGAGYDCLQFAIGKVKKTWGRGFGETLFRKPPLLNNVSPTILMTEAVGSHTMAMPGNEGAVLQLLLYHDWGMIAYSPFLLLVV